ncbi:MAG TPA: hypothetical protein VJ809_15415 [Pirellulales bacterium]|jgi:hypothetical protein|nr:hypothetical protein [Pirellulales bacterium]
MSNDAEATYHRTFTPFNPPRYNAWADIGKTRNEIVDSLRRTIPFTAHGFNAAGRQPIRVSFKKDQDFAKYATSWEHTFSKCVRGEGGTAEPVVDENLTVIGHIGWFWDSDVWIPAARSPTDKLQDMIKAGDPVFVAKARHVVTGYRVYSRGDTMSYQLMTSLDGAVLAHLASRVRDGVRESAFQPTDFLGAGLARLAVRGAKVAIRVARSGVRKVVPALMSKQAPRVAAIGPATELAVAAAQRAQTNAPAVARALATQANLQSHKITRSVTLLQKPTVFRHSITADVKPASFAQIEKSRSLHFSTGAKAHYGEGVYVWPANKSGVGHYIDIEVPAGTAAEQITVASGSWYRLVSAQGNRLSIKIVGHSFTQEEVAMGRMLVGK